MVRAGSAAGFALPVTLLVLIVLSGLISSIFFFAYSSRQVGTALIGAERAWYATEGEVGRAMGDLDPRQLTQMRVGTTTMVRTGPISVSIARLGRGFFLLSSSTSQTTRRRVGMLAHLVPPAIVLDRGLSTEGAVTTGPDAKLLQRPDPTETVCPSAAGSADTTIVGFAASVYEPIQRWIQQATHVLPPGITVSPAPSTSSSVCNIADPLNWGRPASTGPCANHYPAVHAEGDLLIAGGMGQGVLTVAGDLSIEGAFQFRGLVIVVGRMQTNGAGAEIRGAVQVLDTGGVGSVLAGATLVAYSPCWLARALLPFGTVSAPTERGAILMY